MITTPIIKNDNYEKILAFLDPEKYKTEAEKDPFKQKYSDTKFIGKPKRPAPTPVSKPTTANIKEYSEANLMFMNINSMQSR